MFVKLFAKILDSSIWSESKETRLLWITMLVKADAAGSIEASLPGLARLAGLTIEETKQSLEILMAPDENSSTKDFDGRRVLSMDGGWMLVNYEKYRAIRNAEERREYKRQWMREKRAAAKAVDTVDNVDNCGPKQKQKQKQKEKQHSTPLQSPQGGKAEKPKRVVADKPQAWEELREYGREINLPIEECRACWDYWESTGWRRKSGLIRDWKAVVRTWRYNWLKREKEAEVRQSRFQPKGKTLIEVFKAESDREFENAMRHIETDQGPTIGLNV